MLAEVAVCRESFSGMIFPHERDKDRDFCRSPRPLLLRNSHPTSSLSRGRSRSRALNRGRPGRSISGNEQGKSRGSPALRFADRPRSEPWELMVATSKTYFTWLASARPCAACWRRRVKFAADQSCNDPPGYVRWQSWHRFGIQRKSVRPRRCCWSPHNRRQTQHTQTLLDDPQPRPSWRLRLRWRQHHNRIKRTTAVLRTWCNAGGTR